MNNNKKQNRFNESTLNLSFLDSIEWLVNYSSQVKNKDLSNCLLVDSSYNIIGFKYNGVTKTQQVNKKNYSSLEIKKLDIEKPKNFGYYIIGLDKKGVYQKDNVKYQPDYKHTYLKYFLYKLNIGIS